MNSPIKLQVRRVVFIIGTKKLQGKQANRVREITSLTQFWFLDFGFTLPYLLYNKYKV